MPDWFAWRRRLPLLAAFVAGAWLSLATLQPASGIEPDDPAVRSVVDKALGYLEKADDARLGAKCLIGISFLKNGRDGSHPKVQAALKACEEANPGDTSLDNYSLGLALIFLCELDAQKHQNQVNRYLEGLIKRQKQNGGWGYLDGSHGGTSDNSQTQYAVLGLWMAQRHGADIPVQVLERVMNYLLRVQDPSGAWGYQGVDPGNFTRVNQNDVSVGRTTAALGSILILADLIEMQGSQQQANNEKKLPAALVAVEDKKERPRKRRAAVDAAVFKRAVTDGNAYLKNKFILPDPSYNGYFMYSYERYRAYLELYELQYEIDPRWYTDGFEYLKKTQSSSGEWTGSQPGAVETSFGVLFLSRSSRKAIALTGVDLGQGVLRGGMGLPANTADIRENNGRLVETPLAGSVDELLALVEDEDNPELMALAESSQIIKTDKDISKRSGQLARLRSLVRAESPDARLVAVRSLGAARDLDDVPMLLYALTDPDMRVVLEADKWLRFVSRKVEGVGLEPGPTADQVKAAQKAWTAWYLSIRPDAELLE